MTANLRIASKNHVDDSRCVLSCSASPILPLANLQSTVRGRILRVAAGSGIQIKGTYGGEAVRASMAAIVRHNLEADATWRFQGYSDAAWTTQVVDSGTVAAIDVTALGDLDFGVDALGSGPWDSLVGQKLSRVYIASTVLLSWKITINDPTNSSGVIDVCRAWVAKYFEFDMNPVHGSKVAWKEDSQMWNTDGGTPRVDAGTPYRQLALNLEWMPETDRRDFMDILRRNGMRSDLFVDLMPDGNAHELVAFCADMLIQQMPDLTFAEFERFSSSIVLREI